MINRVNYRYNLPFLSIEGKTKFSQSNCDKTKSFPRFQ